ncbi:MAG: alkaline phosphatase family protein [Acidobacteriota bacterium]
MRDHPGAPNKPPASAGACCALAVLSLLVCGLPSPPARAAAGPWDHVLIVGWDGVQRDHLHECLARRLPGCEQGLPNLEALSGGRVFDLVVTSAYTETKPGWVEILTGLDARPLGIESNRSYRPVPEGFSLFERLERHLGEGAVTSLFIAGKGENLGGRCDVYPQEPWCITAGRVDFFRNNLGGNDAVGAVALARLEASRGAEHLVAFVHFEDPDHTGHQSGENSAAYTSRLLDDDRWLGLLVDKLHEVRLLARTLVYVVTDHGFDEGRKSHLNAPFGFVAGNDPGILRAADRKDITPTVLKRFGAPLGAVGFVPAVEGRPLDEVPDACVAEGAAFLDYPGAPGCCPGLVHIGLDARFNPLKWDRPCIPATGAVGDLSGYCTACGDGVCRSPEQHCNCPQDCPDGAPVRSVLADLTWAWDFRPGEWDAGGNFLGGTETMELLAHGGRLFASVGFWMDQPYLLPKGGDPWTGAQIMVKDSASSPWRLAANLGTHTVRVDALQRVQFSTDAVGAPFPSPLTLLLAGTAEHGSETVSTVWVSDEAGKRWTRTEVAGGSSPIRSFGSHRDSVTGVHNVFAGSTKGEVFRGALDPASPAPIVWSAAEELSAEGRVMAFAEANGVLYAAVVRDRDAAASGGLFRRIDGPEPRWELVYQWPFVAGSNAESNTMRGLTAVPDPAGGGHEVLVATRANPGGMERIDPMAGHRVTVELDIRAFLSSLWDLDEYTGPALSAYNRLVPATDPTTGERVHLIGLWVSHPEGRVPPHNGSFYLVRHLDGRYELGEINDLTSPLPSGEGLRATRGLEVSPFPEEGGRVVYSGGYDCAGILSHNTGWIMRGEVRLRLPRRHLRALP